MTTALIIAARTVRTVRAEAATLRAQVDAEMTAELAANVYLSSYTGERITAPDDAWTMGAEAFATFQARQNAPEYCPALVAESAVRAAEAALVEAGRALPGCGHVSPDRLNCSRPDVRREYVRLLLELGA